jgi:hypothetical protein
VREGVAVKEGMEAVPKTEFLEQLYKESEINHCTTRVYTPPLQGVWTRYGFVRKVIIIPCIA